VWDEFTEKSCLAWRLFLIDLNPFGGSVCIYSVKRFTQERWWYPIEDFILVRKIQAGDKEAFDTLVHKYYHNIYQFCYRRLNGDADTAADITQDVFLKLLENIHAVRMLGKFQNYLLTIAVNTCSNYFKKAKPEYMDMETAEFTDESSTLDERLIQEENRMEVQRGINSLPDHQKEVIILRFYHDLKIREISVITKTSIPTVKSRLQQGLKKLQRYLSDARGGGGI